MSWDPSRFPRGRGAVRLDVSGRVATIVLDNPTARNAMSVGMMTDMISIVAELESSDVLAVLIHGAGEAGFCAGGDLRDVRAHLLNPESAKGMPEVMGDVLDRLSRLHAVVVAAVEGAALGGGAELITAADWVVSSRRSTIGFVHARLGVTPGWGGARRLIRRVGARSALPIMVQATLFDGEQAKEVGLVDQVVADGTAVSAATDWISSMLKHPEASVRGVLEIVRAASAIEQLSPSTERAVFSRLWGGEAHNQALGGVKAGG